MLTKIAYSLTFLVLLFFAQEYITMLTKIVGGDKKSKRGLRQAQDRALQQFAREEKRLADLRQHKAEIKVRALTSSHLDLRFISLVLVSS